MGFVANFIRFPAVQKFKNRLRFDKVLESLKVGTFLRHSVGHALGVGPCDECVNVVEHIS